jgi:MFS family permease
MTNEAAAASLSPVPAVSLAAADGASRQASLTLALTQPGDTVLYLLLPLYADTFAVSLPEAGLLLAANRLVRIAGYGWVGRGYERFGPRAACVLAALGAAAATFDYALFSGVLPLLLGRLLWGLSFAAMNVSTQALATAEARNAARRSGRSRSIIAAGPMLGLIIGAILADVIGPRAVFMVLGAIALLGLPVALRLPRGRGQPMITKSRRLSVPAPLDVWSFMQGLTLDGIFVVGLSVLAQRASPDSATLAAGLALALRYLAEIVLGPPSGAIAERCGAARSLIGLSFASVIAYAAIAAGALWAGVVGVVLLRGMLAPLAAPVAAAANPGAQRVAAIARMASWRDIGAALGPLIAGLVLPITPGGLYIGAALALAAATAALAVLGVGAGRRGAR